MKTALLPQASASKKSAGLAAFLRAAKQALQRAIREQAAALPAIGLAENGDIEGAAQLLADSTRGRS